MKDNPQNQRIMNSFEYNNKYSSSIPSHKNSLGSSSGITKSIITIS
jgi:hypothetical protein